MVKLGFKPLDSIKQPSFNSANSSEFLDLCGKIIDDSILEGELHTPSRTFAPSQIRCKRVSWFRLRGVVPEQEAVVDRATNFTAVIGTACHQHIQELLSNYLNADWIDVADYLAQKNFTYEYKCTKSGFETSVEIFKPVPIKFAPDGIVFWKGKYWLLEIKTSEYSSFEKLSGPKPQHVDQIKCYATLLGINNVLVIYQDRMYGGMKCYEVTVTSDDMREIWDMFKEVQECAALNIAPEKPETTKYCNPSYCRYYNKCKEW